MSDWESLAARLQALEDVEAVKKTMGDDPSPCTAGRSPIAFGLPTAWSP